MRRLPGQGTTYSFAALMLVFIPLELASAWLAYHTIGEIISSLLFLVVGLNIMPVLLFLLRKRLLATILAVALVAAIVPYQAVLGHRLLTLQAEAGSVVSYLYKTKLETGTYPADLAGYSFNDSNLKGYFHEYHLDSDLGGFGLYWYVCTPNTSHSYTPKNGWGYYPD